MPSNGDGATHRAPWTLVSERTRKGNDAEDRALSHLTAEGLRLVERNVRSRGGEIDLVMRDDDALVFIEVRSRRSRAYGGALASIDARKQQRILLAARTWLARHPREAMRALRFDVVAFEGDEDPQWLRNVLETDAP